ncbi:hypothetical protein BpHYR1_003222 [Brachionus plicatilis]|uniref:Uncharacterized protein n=1 Tax=Brachionus plicatilis TaxID=10195 RepID=A0A3M7RXC4_BRAPC|nr:hypothetical protein BpHYR1_003222 [Brachionus plicatilis]
MTKDGWYEGLQLFTPSTNNSLEATNRVIKDEDTLRDPKDVIKISDKEIHRYDNAKFNSFDTFKNVQFDYHKKKTRKKNSYYMIKHENCVILQI